VIPLSAGEAASALGVASVMAGVPGLSIDSRTICPGDLFVALQGERFDGHAYVAEVLAAGAGGAVVDAAWWDEGRNPSVAELTPDERKAIYPVEDTLAALGRLANAVRRKSGALIIAVTGSVGKTGTKDMLGMMAAQAGRTMVTPANQNNEIGVPLTLLAIEPDTSTVIVEMGMRGRGQIAALAEIAEPDVGLITNIHPVHLELLGSMENVAQAKAELLAGLKPDGVGVVPAECDLLEPHVASSATRTVSFGLATEDICADVWADYVRSPGGSGATLTVHWPGGEAMVRTRFASRAKMENAVAAAAACFAAGLPLEACLRGLEDVTLTPARGDLERVGDWLVINDTYNASPAAVRASLDELAHIAADRKARPVAVLGDMLELGPETGRFHREIGTYAAETGVQVLWGVGPLSKSTTEGFRERAGSCVAGHVDVAAEFGPVLETLRPGDVILFKASRSLKLEIMVSLLRDAEGSEGLGRESDSGRESGLESVPGSSAVTGRLGGGGT
jgi:UDP-N-acetylmuramoyl-tripeptide--D-alanyl-D-alanine ligase